MRRYFSYVPARLFLARSLRGFVTASGSTRGTGGFESCPVRTIRRGEGDPNREPSDVDSPQDS